MLINYNIIINNKNTPKNIITVCYSTVTVSILSPSLIFLSQAAKTIRESNTPEYAYYTYSRYVHTHTIDSAQLASHKNAEVTFVNKQVSMQPRTEL